MLYFLLKGVTVACVSNCVGWVVRTGRGRDRCWLCMRNTRRSCMVIAAWNVAMSGRGNWWVRSMKTPSLGNSACAKIGWLYSPTQIRAIILALITLLTTQQRSVQILCSAIRCARACACAIFRVYMSYIPVTRSTGPLPS